MDEAGNIGSEEVTEYTEYKLVLYLNFKNNILSNLDIAE